MIIMIIFALISLFWLFLEFIFWDHMTRKPTWKPKEINSKLKDDNNLKGD